jgi:hypothetical protein
LTDEYVFTGFQRNEFNGLEIVKNGDFLGLVEIKRYNVVLDLTIS